MTGFGTGEAPLGGGRVLAEVRSVNQRHLDVRARLPRELADLAMFAEQVARERLRRGRVDLALRLEGAALAPCVLDRPRARAALRELAALRDELSPGAELPLSLLSAVPELFVSPAAAELPEVRQAVRGAIVAAIDAMDAMALSEGERLASDMLARTARVRALVVAAAARAEAARDAVRRRNRESVERLLAGTGVALDPARLEAEIVLLAERGDVTEELTRLRSHLVELDVALSAPEAAPVGRRIDFLLQEMVREANTLGAKAQDAEASHQVVAIKVELERLREQVQNVE